MNNVLFSVLIVFCLYSCINRDNTTSTQETKTHIQEYKNLTNYAFVINDEIIPSSNLNNFTNPKLYKYHPHEINIKNQKYEGALYFETSNRTYHNDEYINDPAFFVNEVLVSSYDIRSIRPENFINLKKSTRDTIIGQKKYKGAIWVDTEEDYFSSRLNLERYITTQTKLPLTQVIVHWFNPTYENNSYTGSLISNNFKTYYLDPSNLNIGAINMFSIGSDTSYIINIVDSRYKQGYNRYKQGILIVDQWHIPEKSDALFQSPRSIDPKCPCYLNKYDITSITIAEATELRPEPYGGNKSYLNKLSLALDLSKTKNDIPTESDSLSVSFLVTKTGMIANLESLNPNKPDNEIILNAIKKHSCVWSLARNSGRPMVSRRKMKIIYSKNQQGNIIALTSLKFL